MNNKTALFVALAGLIVLYYRSQQTEIQKLGFVPWSPPAAAQPYLPLIVASEQNYNLPSSLLARVLDIESAYRDDIIQGLKRSSAGALGIAQIVPRYHPDIDPLDPAQAIPYAARYLQSLYAMFGTWPKAIAAYNWGLGNLKKYLSGEIESIPSETKNYLQKIFGSSEL